MKRFTVPYGERNLLVEIDERNIADIIGMPKINVSRDDTTLAKALRAPLGPHSLRQFLNGAKELSIVVNDGARPTRTAWVIDLLEEDIRDKDVHFVVATGAHACPNESGLHKIFGTSYRRHGDCITIHDAREENAHEYTGKTRYGNEVWLNKLVTGADKILIIGSIEPHYFAGLTGGRKSLLPGVAAYRTIEQNHSLALHPGARPLNLDGNPIHEEMVDCIEMFGRERIFGVQMILNSHHDVWRAFAGPIDETFECAACIARGIFSTKIKQRADVVVSVSRPPLDNDLYQTLKAIEHGRLALKPGGILIVVSPCSQGLGPVSFSRLFESNIALDAAAQNAQTGYRLGDHNAHNLISLRKQAEIWMVTKIDASILETLKIEPFGSLQAALRKAISMKGYSTKILFLLDANLTVPILI